MHTQIILLVTKMAEKAKKVCYTAEELLKYRYNSAPCKNFRLLPQLDLKFDDSVCVCPVSRWYWFCKWEGDFRDLKQHFQQKHVQVLRLQTNGIVLTKSNYIIVNRGFIISDDAGNEYLVNASYYVDRKFYINVIPLQNLAEIRRYRVRAMGRCYLGTTGGLNYVGVEGLPEFFAENEILEISVELL